MDSFDRFAEWDNSKKEITFTLVEGISTGLHRTKVTLDDGED